MAISSCWSAFLETRLSKVEATKAKGCLLVDARNDTFSGIRVIFTDKAARLHGDPIPVKQGIELIERERSGTAGADEEQVAFCEAGLNGGHVERLQ